MQRYANNVTTQTGLAVPGAIVTVLDYPSLKPATIYSNSAGAAQANPIIADNLGFFAFYAPDGHYSLVIGGRGIASYQLDDILLNDNLAVDLVLSGTTAQRPTPLFINQTYFDTSLGIQIVAKQLSPAIWVDAAGVQV